MIQTYHLEQESQQFQRYIDKSDLSENLAETYKHDIKVYTSEDFTLDTEQYGIDSREDSLFFSERFRSIKKSRRGQRMTMAAKRDIKIGPFSLSNISLL